MRASTRSTARAASAAIAVDSASAPPRSTVSAPGSLGAAPWRGAWPSARDRCARCARWRRPRGSPRRPPRTWSARGACAGRSPGADRRRGRGAAHAREEREQPRVEGLVQRREGLRVAAGVAIHGSVEGRLVHGVRRGQGDLAPPRVGRGASNGRRRAHGAPPRRAPRCARSSSSRAVPASTSGPSASPSAAAAPTTAARSISPSSRRSRIAAASGVSSR